MIGCQESPHRSTCMFFFTLCIHISRSRASNCRRALSTIKVARPKPLTLRRGPSTSKNTPAECAYKFCYMGSARDPILALRPTPKTPRSRPTNLESLAALGALCLISARASRHRGTQTAPAAARIHSTGGKRCQNLRLSPLPRTSCVYGSGGRSAAS